MVILEAPFGSLARIQRFWGRLLLVVFDRVGFAHVGDVWVLAGVTAGAALAEEIPVLVEADVDVV